MPVHYTVAGLPRRNLAGNGCANLKNCSRDALPGRILAVRSILSHFSAQSEVQRMNFRRLSRNSIRIGAGVLAVALVVAGLHGNSALAADKPAVSAPTWSPAAAAHYMDQREVWWQGWDRAQKDHGTLCISCHTQAAYGLARPVLRSQLGEHSPSPQEQIMLGSIEKRVREWKDMQPFYSDALYGTGKEIESRNAESVLNAVILSSYDAASGRLSDTTRLAFDNAWALQTQSGPDAGAWVWQNFEYTPWESKESQYHWAALMAVTLGKVCHGSQPEKPASTGNALRFDGYCAEPKVVSHLNLLLGYLSSHYEAQPLVNKVVALWAEKWFPGVVTYDQGRALIDDLNRLQHEDGGWSLTDLGTWQRRDKTPLETRSDGYATGLVVLVLEEIALTSHTNPHVARGIGWLETNQDKTSGAWPAWSLNKNRDLETPVGKFMSDAATSYAVLALEARR
jgi:squalene-hopene/tetraprenyl-beta-curcumene cyclase